MNKQKALEKVIYAYRCSYAVKQVHEYKEFCTKYALNPCYLDSLNLFFKQVKAGV